MNITEDLAREQRIDRLYFRLLSAKTAEARRDAYALMRAEINQRSKERVAQMEREKGLL